MLEHLLVEMREILEMVEVGHRQMKACEEEIKTNQERITALLDTNKEKMRACIGVTEAIIKASPKEMRVEVKTGPERVKTMVLDVLSGRDRGCSRAL
jgi:hypothetical protein